MVAKETEDIMMSREGVLDKNLVTKHLRWVVYWTNYIKYIEEIKNKTRKKSTEYLSSLK